MSNRTGTWAIAPVLAALLAAPAGAQPLSDVQAVPISNAYPGFGVGPTASDPMTLVVIGKGCAQSIGRFDVAFD